MQVNGVPLCANSLMADQLRGRIGFGGMVITDCGSIDFMLVARLFVHVRLCALGLCACHTHTHRGYLGVWPNTSKQSAFCFSAFLLF